ncbi:hypothetical protein PPGU19_088360 (plasmid) [Paraburkholderia sp. PGU19]|nr:hypothetical protein PPGU19_088360 [Paraburkholderia sp. PGU19]
MTVLFVILIPACDQFAILAGVDEALRVTNNESAIESSVRVAASYTLLGYFLPYHLQRIATLYPGLSIRLHEARRDEIEEGLLADRYDIAVLLADNVASSGLAVERIFASTRRLWVASNHSLLEKRSVTFADVAKEPFIMLTVDEAADTAMRYWSKTDYQPHVILQTSSVEAVRSMVANGSGVAILSDMVYRPWSLEGKRIETITLANPALQWRAASHTHATERSRPACASSSITSARPSIRPIFLTRPCVSRAQRHVRPASGHHQRH